MNLGRENVISGSIKATLRALVKSDTNSSGASIISGEEAFQDMVNRIVITAVPEYLARFTSCNQVVAYQRRFMNAAKGQK